MTVSPWQRRPEGRATIGDAVHRQALREPRKPAIIVHEAPSRSRVYTYQELDELSGAFARGLIDLGVGVGDRVAMLSANRPEYLVAYLGALKAGASFTGINDRFLAHEVRWQVEHVGAKVLVVDDPQRDAIRALLDDLPAVTACIALQGACPGPMWHSYDAVLEAHGGGPEVDAAVDEDTVALLSYTSGTEALPKGILLPHRNYLISTAPSLLHAGYIGPQHVELVVKPFYTIAGVGSMTSLLLVGETIVMLEPSHPERVLEAVAEHRVTVLSQTPTFYMRLTQHPSFGRTDLSSVQQCHVYGGVVSRPMIDRFTAVAPQAVWANYWGQSELTQLGIIGWFRTFEDIPGGDPRWIGRPTAGLEVRVVDDEDRPADVGEMICRSPGLMLGYHREPELTAAAVRDGWLHTGDIVRTDADGELFFVDRRKDVIKTGGMNVSSLEVEHVLLGHPAVLDAAVVGVTDEVWSEAVTAFVVPRTEAAVSAEDLIAFCRERLAHYKAPKRVRFVGDLPRDPQGKVRKALLRAAVATPGQRSEPTARPRS